MYGAVFNYLGESIKRLVMASFVFVLLLPVTFFIHSMFQNSWQQVEQKMLEKHLLISEALVTPFTLFFSTRQQSLRTLGQELLSLSTDERALASKENKELLVQSILDKHLNSFGNFVSLSYAPNSQSAIQCVATINKDHPHTKKPIYSALSLRELPAPTDSIVGQDLMSPVFKSSISNKPVVLIKHRILNAQKKMNGIIYAEISLEQIGSMCSKINFGALGHCAVVDNTGHVVAHPRKAWMDEVKDLSQVSIVQKMLAGKSGTTEFYSPALLADMVAGFSTIPDLGWGVMIPQPKSEITNTLDTVRFNTLIWLVVGVLAALLVSIFLTRKITGPITLLIKRTDHSKDHGDRVSLGKAPQNTPSEIKQLWGSFSNLLAGLQRSNQEIKRLNISLQEDILKATADLREMNKSLYKTSSQDYLTSLSNRRHFTHYLEDVLLHQIDKNVGIINIDIDKFKGINDQHGHDVGDLALKHLSGVLKRSVRPCDLVARLGGDEFIVYLDNPSDKLMSQIAEAIRMNMERSPLVLSKQTLHITLSIGTANQRNDGKLSLEELLRFADQAMYQSKISGRNQVSAHQADMDESVAS